MSKYVEFCDELSKESLASIDKLDRRPPDTLTSEDYLRDFRADSRFYTKDVLGRNVDVSYVPCVFEGDNHRIDYTEAELDLMNDLKTIVKKEHAEDYA